MGFLDNLNKTIMQGVDRAKFEADKFQKTTRIQGELNELRRQLDTRRLEFGDRALELYKAGQIQSATLGEILRGIETLQSGIVLKEEELKLAQSDVFVETSASSRPTTQTYTAPTAQPRTPPPTTPVSTQPGVKSCPNCQFQMPASALFCPSCGARIGI